MRRWMSPLALAALLALAQGPAAAQAVPGSAASDSQDSLRIYFDLGSAHVGGSEEATLDQAARLFRDGSPIVMIVAGGADTVGDPTENLDLSIRRAQAVADGLVARGIPAERLQVLGRGTSELAVPTEGNVASRENRLVEITWR